MFSLVHIEDPDKPKKNNASVVPLMASFTTAALDYSNVTANAAALVVGASLFFFNVYAKSNPIAMISAIGSITYVTRKVVSSVLSNKKY